MDFLFGDPTFVKALDPDKTATKAFLIEADGLKLATTLQQKKAARDCAAWIKQKVAVKSVTRAHSLPQRRRHGLADAPGGTEGAQRPTARRHRQNPLRLFGMRFHPAWAG
jgi:hypothetical protein